MPVVDMLRAAKPDLTPVLITSGAEAHLTNGVWYVPKVELLAGVWAALETGDLRIARRDAGDGDAGAGTDGRAGKGAGERGVTAIDVKITINKTGASAHLGHDSPGAAGVVNYTIAPSYARPE